jgi:hypothetical protein
MTEFVGDSARFEQASQIVADMEVLEDPSSYFDVKLPKEHTDILAQSKVVEACKSAGKVVLKHPVVTDATNKAKDELAREWGSLSTGEKAALLAQAAVMGGGALAGVLSTTEGRTWIGQLVASETEKHTFATGVPELTFKLQLTNPGPGVTFNLNVGRLLPPQLGFSGSVFSPPRSIMGP